MRAPRLIVVSLHKAGMHLVRRLIEELGYRMTYFEDEEIERAQAGDAAGFLDGLAHDAAFFVHDLPIDRFPRPVLEHWRARGEPPLLFHYRDPRAVLLAQVNYLRSRSADGRYSQTSEHLLYADILEAAATEQEALGVAIRLLGDYLVGSYTRSLWMLFHPRVCRTTYEDLVGPHGGGEAAAQHASVRRVMSLLGAGGDAARIASRLYDPTQRTFHRGQAHAWRSVYTPQLSAAFDDRYGWLLELYGYPAAGNAAAG